MRKRDSAGGFTLMEILVALVIMAMFSAAVYSVFLRSLVDTRSSRAAMEVSRRGAAILRLLRKDLRSCLPQGGEWIHFLGSMEGEGASRLEFVTAVDSRENGEEGNPSDLVKVLWRLEPSGDALSRLYRGEEPGGARTRDEGEEAERLLDDRVKEFSLEYFDGSSWKTSWSGLALPEAVRARLVLTRKIQFRPSSPAVEKDFEFRDLVPIPVAEGRASHE